MHDAISTIISEQSDKTQLTDIVYTTRGVARFIQLNYN